MVSSRVPVTQEQIYGLFDLIPGIEYCEMQRDQFGFGKGASYYLDCNLCMYWFWTHFLLHFININLVIWWFYQATESVNKYLNNSL